MNSHLAGFLSAITIACVVSPLGGQEPTSVNPKSNMSDSQYVEAIKGWQLENEKKLASPTGWLALIGHVWLKQGEQSIGTRPEDTIRLPKDFGDQALGSIRVDGQRVFLRCVESSGIQVNGEWRAERELAIDSTKLESDSLDQVTIGNRVKLQLVRRNGKLAIRVRDAQSDAISRFSGQRWFPIDRRYCVEATYHAYEQPQSIRIVNIRGDETSVEVVGFVEFECLGHKLQLDAMLDSPTELFLIFKDRTNGKTTYGPGRFVNAPLPKDGEKFELDFNRTYNPPCAYSPFTLCPLPPKQNHLDMEIEAGEMIPRGY